MAAARLLFPAALDAPGVPSSSSLFWQVLSMHALRPTKAVVSELTGVEERPRATLPRQPGAYGGALLEPSTAASDDVGGFFAFISAIQSLSFCASGPAA